MINNAQAPSLHRLTALADDIRDLLQAVRISDAMLSQVTTERDSLRVECERLEQRCHQTLSPFQQEIASLKGTIESLSRQLVQQRARLHIQKYPGVRYHQNGRQQVVQSATEERRLCRDPTVWFESPADAATARALKRTRQRARSKPSRKASTR